jgi:formylglycine-generating enzyme required for sulfatase activity
MRLRHVFFPILLPFASLGVASPRVVNLDVSQRPGTDLVDLTYDLEGGGFGAVRIRLEVSSNGGAGYSVPVTAVSGDVGEGILPGTGKSIVWNAGVDWNGKLATRIRVRLSAETGLVEIPGGTFTMGRTSGDTDPDAPPVAVTLATLYLAETETTKADWDSVRVWGLANGYPDLAAGAGKTADHPVHSVSWTDVVKWCNARSEKEGLTPCYTVSGLVFRTGTATPDVDWSAGGYRLPTEAEWEKAARGGVFGKRFPSGGDTISHGEANFRNEGGEAYQTGTTGHHPDWGSGSFPHTSPVKTFPANGYGLFGMAGGVFEWCWDWYDASAYLNGALNPGGPASGVSRVFRGGSWASVANDCRAARRSKVAPSGSGEDLGFRVARGRLFDRFASIPGGTFAMGRTSGDSDADAPPIIVTVGSFSLQDTETTKAGWDDVRDWAVANGYADLAVGGAKGAGHPVHSVTWFDAVKWCNARSERERLTPVYSIGGAVMRTGTGMPVADWSADGYRLPTEAEWERAARGGIAGVRFPWGTDTIAHQQANYFSSASFFSYDTSVTRDFHPSHTSGGTPYTAPAGSFPRNGFGLGDLSGNVAEWCWDWYHSSHYLSSNGTTDPRGAAPSGYRVMRGGSWNSLATRCRASDRQFALPSEPNHASGFRPARVVRSGASSTSSGDLTIDTRDTATLSLASLNQSYDGNPRPVTATTNPPGLGVKFTYDGSATAPTGAGTYAVVATIDDAEYRGSASGTLVIAKAAQSISFPPIPARTASATVTLSATGGASGNPVTFAVTDGPGQVAGSTLSFTGAGTVQVAASQAGDANHEAATPVARSIDVSKADAGLTLTGLSRSYDGLPKTAGAETDPAGLAVQFTYDDSPTPPVNAGAYAVVATINDARYQGSASRVLVIAPMAQTISFSSPGDRFIDEVIDLSASGGASGNPVTFRVLDGPAVVDGSGRLAFTGAGVVTIAAEQAGGPNHSGAPAIERRFTVHVPKPDVAVGSARGSLKGVGLTGSITGQQVSIGSRGARAVKGRTTVANRSLLPGRRAADSLIVRGHRGNRYFRVNYLGPMGTVTASIVAGTHRTPKIDANDAAIAYRIRVKPNRRRLTTTRGGRAVISKKTFSSLIQAESGIHRPASDSGLIRVWTR